MEEEDNIKMNLNETGRDCAEHRAQNRTSWRELVNVAMNLRFPRNLGNLFNNYANTRLLRASHWGSNCALYEPKKL